MKYLTAKHDFYGCDSGCCGFTPVIADEADEDIHDAEELGWSHFAFDHYPTYRKNETPEEWFRRTFKSAVEKHPELEIRVTEEDLECNW